MRGVKFNCGALSAHDCLTVPTTGTIDGIVDGLNQNGCGPRDLGIYGDLVLKLIIGIFKGFLECLFVKTTLLFVDEGVI